MYQPCECPGPIVEYTYIGEPVVRSLVGTGVGCFVLGALTVVLYAVTIEWLSSRRRK